MASPAALLALSVVLFDGDVIFQESRSSQSLAIQLATHSKYSHVGMIVHRGREVMVIEAVEPVKVTPLAKFIARGERGHYVIKRLKEPPSEEARAKLIAAARVHLGKHYDLAFAFDDRAMYCSELVYKAYRQALGIELAPTRPLREYDLTHKAVRAKLVERYGRNIPLEEPMIAPQALFESPLLETVVEQ